jgi:hypothetical protein
MREHAPAPATNVPPVRRGLNGGAGSDADMQASRNYPTSTGFTEVFQIAVPDR